MSLLATALPSANSLTQLYTVPTAKRAVVNMTACNRATSAATLRIAFTSKSTPVDSEYVEFDTSINANDSIERTAIALSEGEHIFVQANSASVAFNVWGIEEIA
ncbi:MAG TPA: hypothetical protein PLU46_00350 [Thiotrichales bacterium]|nr:hypothetical protein [Thiotrichales bacterium]